VRNLDAEEPLLARGVDRLSRKARVAIDRFSLRRCGSGDRCRPLMKRTPVGKEWKMSRSLLNYVGPTLPE
jgi:hypothetical protein